MTQQAKHGLRADKRSRLRLRYKGKIIFLVAVVVAVAATGLAPAAADDGLLTAAPEQDTGTVDESAPAETPDLSPLTTVEPVTNVGTGTRAVSSTLAGLSVAVDMVGLAGKERTSNADGTTTIEDVTGGVNLTIQTDSTGFAVSAELAAVTSLHQLRFDVSLPDGATLELDYDGSIDVVDADGFTIGAFKAPWAHAADGTVVETSYTVEGRTIVQSVATADEALYPVVADPEFVWGWVTGTIYFNRAETGLICFSAYTALLAMRDHAPLWAATLIGTVIAVALVGVILLACSANMLGKCIKFKSYQPFAFVYSGDRCT